MILLIRWGSCVLKCLSSLFLSFVSPSPLLGLCVFVSDWMGDMPVPIGTIKNWHVEIHYIKIHVDIDKVFVSVFIHLFSSLTLILSFFYIKVCFAGKTNSLEFFYLYALSYVFDCHALSFFTSRVMWLQLEGPAKVAEMTGSIFL